MLDPATLRRLWQVHSERLLLIARSVDAEAAADAVQDAFVALAMQPSVPRDPLAWLVTVTRNRILQADRGTRRRIARENHVMIASWFDSSQAMIDDRLDGEAVTTALRQMPSPTREVIVMHLWGEMTFASIAEVVGLSRASTHRCYRNGIQTLRARFGDGDDQCTVLSAKPKTLTTNPKSESQ